MLLCLAWARFGRRSAAFAGRPASSLPLSMPRGRPSGHTCPLFRQLPSSSLGLLKIVSLGAQLVGSGGQQGTPVNGRRAGPGFLCQQHSVCAPRPRQGSPGPASGASLLLWFQAFLGAENRNQPCVFQAARLLRNSCLSLRTETAFCPPLAPFREGDTCRFQGGFLFCAD